MLMVTDQTMRKPSNRQYYSASTSTFRWCDGE